MNQTPDHRQRPISKMAGVRLRQTVGPDNRKQDPQGRHAGAWRTRQPSSDRSAATRDPIDCGDCFVLTWPWIVELDVNRVLKGQAPTGRVTVLTFQHMEEPTDRDTRWGLRRNLLGVFNEVHLAPGAVLPICAADAPPVEPVIRPANGQALDDLRNELGG